MMEEAGGAVVADGEVAAASRAGKDTTEEESASPGRSPDYGLDKERMSLVVDDELSSSKR